MSFYSPYFFFLLICAGYQLNRNSYIFTPIVVNICMYNIIANKF
jgi:hypothetical protein